MLPYYILKFHVNERGNKSFIRHYIFNEYSMAEMRWTPASSRRRRTLRASPPPTTRPRCGLSLSQPVLQGISLYLLAGIILCKIIWPEGGLGEKIRFREKTLFAGGKINLKWGGRDDRNAKYIPLLVTFNCYSNSCLYLYSIYLTKDFK